MPCSPSATPAAVEMLRTGASTLCHTNHQVGPPPGLPGGGDRGRGGGARLLPRRAGGHPAPPRHLERRRAGRRPDPHHRRHRLRRARRHSGGEQRRPRHAATQATLAVLERQAPGLVAAMLTGSLAVTPLAALSRCPVSSPAHPAPGRRPASAAAPSLSTCRAAARR